MAMNATALADRIVLKLAPKLDANAKKTMRKAWISISEAIIEYIRESAEVNTPIRMEVGPEGEIVSYPVERFSSYQDDHGEIVNVPTQGIKGYIS